MNGFEKMIVGSIPVGEASSYFMKLKYGSAGHKDNEIELLREFASLPASEQQEILKEAGVTEIDAKTKQALQSLVTEEDVKTAAVKTKKLAYAEHILPGTEHYYSDRMRSVLEGLPANVFTPEGVEYTTINGEKLASAFKIALEQTPGIKDYLAQEQEGMQAQEQGEVQYLRQKMQGMQAQQQASQAGQQSTTEQMQALEQQISQSQSAIAMANQSAMEAQSMANTAQQAQLSSTDESLRNAQLAAQMRIAMQQYRSQLMDLVSQDPAADVAAQLKGEGALGPGQDMMGQGAPPTDPNAAAGGAPTGQPPTSGPPTGEQGPANQAAGAQNTPDAAPAEGETGGNNANADSGSKPSKDGAKPNLSIGIKQANAALMGALGGAALGAGSTRVDAGNTGKLKDSISKSEATDGGGFFSALNLAQKKVRLAYSEVSEKHPKAAALTGGLVGAGLGAVAGPQIANIAKGAK